MSSLSVKGLDLSEDNEVCFLEILEAVGINKKFRRSKGVCK